MLKVHSIESFGTQEWPWIRFLIFLQWCLFKCIYCHNPDTIPLEWWKEMSDDELVDMIKQSIPYFWKKWWCTISWWEPLLQAKWLVSLFKKLKKEKINTALDTNWFIRNDDVKELLDLTDIVILDIKHINNDWHKKITGQENTNVLKFLDYLEKINKKTWIRYVLVPWYSDQIEYIEAIGKKYGKYNCIERVEILPYHTIWSYKWKEMWWKYELEWTPPPTKNEIEEAKTLLKKYFDKVFIR